MKFSELKMLSIEDIDLIIRDQQDLYSQEEIAEIEEYREYLVKQEQEKQELKNQRRRSDIIKCPKCDGLNNAINTQCQYCHYFFKEDDYYAPEQPIRKYLEDCEDSEYADNTAGSASTPIGRLLLGFLFSGGGVAAILYGCYMNNNIKAQWDSVWNNGSIDPGTIWIIIGAVAAVVGIIMLVSTFLSKE